MSAPEPEPVAHPPQVLISVTDIRRRPGSQLPVERHLVAEGLTLSAVRVPDGADIRFEGQLESIHEGVVLTGAADVPWHGECRRCLRVVIGSATIEIREVYETRPTAGETWPLEHDHVDLGPLLRDIALLALPLAPLCGQDCRGPAPDEFPAIAEPGDETNGAAGPDAGAQPAKDPRWAALDNLDL